MEYNVFGEVLIPCCASPATGYFRDGLCRTDHQDSGTHVVCAVVTEEFLEFSRLKGNDLTTPIPYWNFPGLQPGSKWCLCISRWLEAEKEGKAPPIILKATHQKALNYTTIEILQKYAYKEIN
tara:strand:- start:700 stop:1068 length:369 start_codon:yes stop_codon:yes gene_type:complete